MKTICLDNVFDRDELYWLYGKLLSTYGWNMLPAPENSKDLNKLYGNIGNLNIDINSHWFLYFKGLIFRINKELINTKIHKNIERIYINATSPFSKHWLHQDPHQENQTSVLIMFSPQWDESWLGSFFVDGEEYKMKPGRIILFDSKEFHTGSNPSETCPYVRLTCNIILKP